MAPKQCCFLPRNASARTVLLMNVDQEQREAAAQRHNESENVAFHDVAGLVQVLGECDANVNGDRLRELDVAPCLREIACTNSLKQIDTNCVAVAATKETCEVSEPKNKTKTIEKNNSQPQGNGFCSP